MDNETRLKDIDNPALYDAMDLLAHFEDEGWDNERLYEACKIVVDVGGAVDQYAQKLHEMREQQLLPPPKKE